MTTKTHEHQINTLTNIEYVGTTRATSALKQILVELRAEDNAHYEGGRVPINIVIDPVDGNHIEIPIEDRVDLAVIFKKATVDLGNLVVRDMSCHNLMIALIERQIAKIGLLRISKDEDGVIEMRLEINRRYYTATPNRRTGRRFFT